MKRNSIILITIIALFFTSCSLISNPTEKENTSNNAVFTLSLGNSARTISPGTIDPAKITDIAVAFTDEATNKETKAIPTGASLSWYIPEGKYTVTVTANFEGKKVTGTAKGVEVTFAKGGTASIFLNYVHESTGNLELKLNADDFEEFYSNDYIRELDNIEETDEYTTYKDLDSKVLLGKLVPVSGNKSYDLITDIILTEDNQGNTSFNITIRSEEVLDSGYYFVYVFSIQEKRPIKLQLKDNLVEILPDTTTKGNLEYIGLSENLYPYYYIDFEYYKDGTNNERIETMDNEDFNHLYLKGSVITVDECTPASIKESYTFSSISNPNLGNDGTYSYKINEDGKSVTVLKSCSVRFYFEKKGELTNPLLIDVPTYHLAGTNSQVVLNKQTQTGCDFFVRTNTDIWNTDKYFVLENSKKSILAVNNCTIEISDKVLDFALLKSNLYILFEDGIYYKSQTDGAGKTTANSGFNKSNVTPFVNTIDNICAITVDNSTYNVYFVTKDGNIYRKANASEEQYQQIASISDEVTVKDIMIYDNILYLISLQKDSENSNGRLYALDLSAFESEPLTLSNYIGYNSVAINTTKDNVFLGPCKILSKDDNYIYIADEGIYIDGSEKKWCTRIIGVEPKANISESSIVEKYVLSDSMTTTDYHFESTYDLETSTFVDLSN